MKSLNRTLSLVLVLVMVLGLVGISAGASFKDEAKINYKEAVGVMTGIGALVGYPDGTFNGAGTVTREEAVKTVVYSVLGADVAKSLAGTATGFADVDAGRWSSGVIAYAVSRGIVNGRDAKTFDPTGNVTANEVGKMMLCAAGYGAKGEFIGSSWELNTAVLANKVGMFAGSKATSHSTPATREETALYAFNGIQAQLVTYNKLFDQYVGQTVKANGKDVDATTMNTVYPKLTQKVALIDGIMGYYWELNGKIISSFVADAKTLATSHDGTAIKDLITPTSGSYIGYEHDDKVYGIVNGAGVKEDALDAAAKQKGAVVNFYDEDGDGKYNTISVTVNTTATLSGDAVTKTSGAVTTVTVPGLPITGLDVKTVVGYEGLKKDDVVLYHEHLVNGVKNYVITKANVITGTLNAYNQMGKVLVIDGKQYSLAATPAAKAIEDYAKFATVPGTTFYTDANGYVVTAVANKTINTLENTVYVLKAEHTAFKTQAQILKADGKTEVVNVAKVAAFGKPLQAVTATNDDLTFADGVLEQNFFYTFTKNTDGSYNLTVAENNTTASVSITKGEPNLTSAIATNGTSFVYYDTAKGTSEVFTGIANAPTYTKGSGKIACVKDGNGLATFVVARDGEYETAILADAKYVFAFSPATTIKVDANKTYYQYKAVVDGAITTINADADTAFLTLDAALKGYKPVLTAAPKFDGDINVTGANVTTAAGTNLLLSTVADIADFKFAGTTLLTFGANGTSKGVHIVNKDAKVFRFNGLTAKAPVEEISLTELDNMSGDAYELQAVKTSLTNPALKTLFVTVKPVTPTTPPVEVTGIKSVTSDAGAYTVNYYGATAPTADQAYEAVKAQIAKDGFAITNTIFDGTNSKYSFTVTKGGVEYKDPLTFTTTSGIVRVYKTGTPKLVVAGTGYAKEDFTVTADKDYAPDNGVVTFTVKYIKDATDTNDTVTVAPTNTKADTAVSASGNLTGFSKDKTWTCSMAVNAQDMGETTITITVTPVS